MVDFFKNNLNYDEIRQRIDEDKNQYSSKGKNWAEFVGVLPTIVSNFHRKKNPRNPSFEYILAVSYKTGKPIEWYLYGKESSSKPVNAVAESNPGYNNHPVPFGPEWSDETIKRCNQLKTILDSDNDIIKIAIRSNLDAFENSVVTEKKKSKDIDELRKRILHLEALNSPAGTNTGTDEAE